MIFTVLVIILALWLLVSLYFFKLATCRKNIFGTKQIGETITPTSYQLERMLDGISWLDTQNIETVHSYGRNAESLCGKLILNENSKKFIVLVHGYRSNPEHNFSYIVQKYFDMGFSILMPIQRTHEGSDGNYITFGYHESTDMFFWSRYLTTRFGQDISIVFHGVSMGAATVVLMNELPLTKNIKGIISDCGFSSAMGIFKHILMKDFNIPKFLATPLLKTSSFISEFVADFPFDDCEPLNAVEEAKVPMFFIHGTDDKFVPCEMSVEMYNACVSEIKDLLLVEGAGHGMSYLTDTKTYEKRLEAFLSKIM